MSDVSDCRSLYLIVGLGNPGCRYVLTRHNIGFLAVETLCERHIGDRKWGQGFHSLYLKGLIEGHSVILQKPMTYMNLSGPAVGALMRYYKIGIKKVLVIHDELDIPAGDIRFKIGGGYGGHNGLSSIGDHIGKDFMRLRIGIGRPQRGTPTDWVLSDFLESERAHNETILEALCDHIPLLLNGDMDGFLRALKTIPSLVK